MVHFDYKGFIAPVFTIFQDDFSVNVSAIEKYGQYLAKSGINGVLIQGTTGEGMSLTVQERKLISEEWVKTAKVTKQHVMVQVGGVPLPDVLDLAKHAESVGADSILCLPELFFKPNSISELIDYLKLVAEAAPKTPLLYYHNPAITKVQLHMGQFLNEINNQIPSFKGIKFTSTDLVEGLEAVKAHEEKFAVFLGADQIMSAAFTLGFDSAIATTLNIFPQLALDIMNACKESNLKEAREKQNKLTRAVEIITKYGSWVPSMKAAMNQLTGLHVGKVRPPLTNITNVEATEMKKILLNLMH